MEVNNKVIIAKHVDIIEENINLVGFNDNAEISENEINQEFENENEKNENNNSNEREINENNEQPKNLPCTSDRNLLVNYY